VAFGPRLPHPDEVLRSALVAEPTPVIVVTGGLDRAGVEPWYVEEAARAIAGHALGEGSPDFNLDRLRAEDAPADSVVGKAETLPVMAARRVILVAEVDRWRVGDQERILAYLARPAPSTTLILSALKLDRRFAFGKTLEALPPALGQVWRFRKLEPAELVRSLIARAKKLGKRLAPAAAEEMIRRSGEDLRLLLSELGKLVTYLGPEGEVIEEEDVAAASSGAGVSDVFAYAEALGRGDLALALSRLQVVTDAGSSAYELIGGLGWHFRTMLKARGGAPMQGRRMELIAAEARKLSPAALQAAHREIYRADVALKAAQGPTGLKDEAVMDRLTRRICFDR